MRLSQHGLYSPDPFQSPPTPDRNPASNRRGRQPRVGESLRGLTERPTGTLGVLVARPMGRANPRARPRGLAGDRAAQTPTLT